MGNDRRKYQLSLVLYPKIIPAKWRNPLWHPVKNWDGLPLAMMRNNFLNVHVGAESGRRVYTVQGLHGMRNFSTALRIFSRNFIIHQFYFRSRLPFSEWSCYLTLITRLHSFSGLYYYLRSFYIVSFDNYNIFSYFPMNIIQTNKI